MLRNDSKIHQPVVVKGSHTFPPQTSLLQRYCSRLESHAEVNYVNAQYEKNYSQGTKEFTLWMKSGQCCRPRVSKHDGCLETVIQFLHMFQ